MSESQEKPIVEGNSVKTYDLTELVVIMLNVGRLEEASKLLMQMSKKLRALDKIEENLAKIQEIVFEHEFPEEVEQIGEIVDESLTLLVRQSKSTGVEHS